jgi:hypothetical protein
VAPVNNMDNYNFVDVKTWDPGRLCHSVCSSRNGYCCSVGGCCVCSDLERVCKFGGCFECEGRAALTVAESVRVFVLVFVKADMSVDAGLLVV